MNKHHFACLILLCLAASLRAQQPAGSPSLPVTQPPQTSPDSSTPTLKVKAKLTVEDVTVTDAKDKPVHGLTQPDFTIKEDGKPQTIKNFQEFGPEQPQAAPPQLPPGIYTNRQAANPSAVNILLFDDLTAGAGARDASADAVMWERVQALKYLNTIPPGSQVAILKLANGLRMVQGFTSDQNVLRAAINSLRPEPIPGTNLLAPSGLPVPSGPAAQFGGGPTVQSGNGPPVQFLVEESCRIMNNESETTTTALDQIAAFVSGIEGRKNLIWFTGGILWLTDYPRARSKIPCVRDYTDQLHQAYGLLNAARVAVYPVLLKPALPNASMLDFANATGGVAYAGSNYLDVALKDAITKGSSYYSLSYVPPPSKYDGKYHTIEVKVDRPALQLHYRVGYTSLDLAKPLAPGKTNPANTSALPVSQFHAAMGHGKPDVTELLFDVSVLPSTAPAKPRESSAPAVMGSLNPKLNGKPLVRYDFTYALPAGEITLAGDDPSAARTGSFEVIVAAFSADGDLLNSNDKTTAFTIKPDQVAHFLQQPSRLHIQLDLPPGKIFLRVGVLDVASQKMGILEIPQTVTKEE